MDRVTVYPSAIPQDTDLLNTNKNTMVALGYALQAILGTSTLVDGLACTPTGPATMTVNVAGGSIMGLQNTDATAYGSLGADTVNQLVKQGIVVGTTNFACPAPVTTGQSVVYLIQAEYQDSDGGSVVLPYYNASNPSVPYSGPGNAGTPNYTVRQGKCVLSKKAGTAATTGTQTTPTPDAGYTALWAITVANGQTTITSGSIAAVAGAPFIGTKLSGKANSGANSDITSLSAVSSVATPSGLSQLLLQNNTLINCTNLAGSTPVPLAAAFATAAAQALMLGQFTANLANPGHIRFPVITAAGTTYAIINFGSATATVANTVQAVAYDIVFPNACVFCFGNSNSISSTGIAANVNSSSCNIAASNAGAVVSFVAIGY